MHTPIDYCSPLTIITAAAQIRACALAASCFISGNTPMDKVLRETTALELLALAESLSMAIEMAAEEKIASSQKEI